MYPYKPSILYKLKGQEIGKNVSPTCHWSVILRFKLFLPRALCPDLHTAGKMSCWKAITSSLPPFCSVPAGKISQGVSALKSASAEHITSPFSLSLLSLSVCLFLLTPRMQERAEVFVDKRRLRQNYEWVGIIFHKIPGAGIDHRFHRS